MIRQETDSIIEFLNEVLRLDPHFVSGMLKARIPCNDKIATHPSIQAWGAGEYKTFVIPEDEARCSFLGLLNGYCGVFDDGPYQGWGPIAAVVEDDGTISGFRRTDCPPPLAPGLGAARGAI